MVTSCSPRSPRMIPFVRSSEVIRTPSSCAAPIAALQARSKVLGGGAYAGTGSYTVQPEKSIKIAIAIVVEPVKLGPILYRMLPPNTRFDLSSLFCQGQEGQKDCCRGYRYYAQRQHYTLYFSPLERCGNSAQKQRNAKDHGE